MLRLLFLLFWCILPFAVSAQSPALTTITNKKTRESYQVLKGDTSIRQGTYKLLGRKNKLYLKGQYQHGERVGVWESFFADGQMYLQYNYDKKELISYKKPQKWPVYRIVGLPKNPDTTGIQPPIFMLSGDYLPNFLMENLRYPADAREAGMGGKVFVSFVVDRHGKTGHFEVKEPIGYGLDEESMRVLELLPQEWLPARLHGEPMEAEVTMPLTFRID